MQSHASRHVVSEHLCDRHTPGSAGTACSADAAASSTTTTAITEAYGRLCIPRLVAAIAQPGLPADDLATALHVLNTLLSTQESKVEAIAAGAPAALVAALLGLSGGEADESSAASTAEAEASQQQQQQRDRRQTLCCNTLEALAQLRQGRAAVRNSAGIQALTSALATVPAAAAAALKVRSATPQTTYTSSCAPRFDNCNSKPPACAAVRQAFVASPDGVASLQQSPVRVAAALVDALSRPSTPLAACRDAAAVLTGLASTDAGVVDACGAQVPAAMVVLARRMLRFDVGGGVAGAQSGSLTQAVLHAACECLGMICHHPDGKSQVRLAKGIEGARRAAWAVLLGPPAVASHAPSLSPALAAITDLFHPLVPPPFISPCGGAQVARRRPRTQGPGRVRPRLCRRRPRRQGALR